MDTARLGSLHCVQLCCCCKIDFLSFDGKIWNVCRCSRFPFWILRCGSSSANSGWVVNEKQPLLPFSCNSLLIPEGEFNLLTWKYIVCYPVLLFKIMHCTQLCYWDQNTVKENENDSTNNYRECSVFEYVRKQIFYSPEWQTCYWPRPHLKLAGSFCPELSPYRWDVFWGKPLKVWLTLVLPGSPTAVMQTHACHH